MPHEKFEWGKMDVKFFSFSFSFFLSFLSFFGLFSFIHSFHSLLSKVAGTIGASSIIVGTFIIDCGARDEGDGGSVGKRADAPVVLAAR